MTKQKKPYSATIQMEIKTHTNQRILAAVKALTLDFWLDEITLFQIAEKANVSIQTLFRHFGSREQLIQHAVNLISADILSQHAIPDEVSVQSIVSNLNEYYDLNGLFIIRLRSQAARLAEFEDFQVGWQNSHHQWIQNSFAIYLQALTTISQNELADTLFGLTDVHFWYVYHHELRKSRQELNIIWVRILRSLLLSYR
ncbi:MAG: TetR/AcrR family transcriptional regulator [Anaerolineaceae bacterium]|nr:TetR/AcrR family transcriptional regulator [Anaerolineaceae bacterium]